MKVSIPRDKAIAIAEPLRAALNAHWAGSVRRERATVGDVDLVAIGEPPAFDWWEEQGQVIRYGLNMVSIAQNGLQVDVVFCQPGEFGACLMYLTGSKWFNVRMRAKAKRQGLLLNQHGLWTRDYSRRLAGQTEEEIFAILGMDFVPPQERE